MFQLKPVKIFGHAHHVVEAVGRDRIAAAIQLRCSIGVELVEADGEQLHHLTRVVLVRIAVGVALVIGQIDR